MSKQNPTRRTTVAAITALGGLAAAGTTAKSATAQNSATEQQAFDLASLIQKNNETDGPYLRFFDNKTMSTGIYTLKAGQLDQQQPHQNDELYVVSSGKAKLRAGNETFDAVPGSIFFVKANIEHRFVDIQEDLNIIVFFSKAPS